MVHSFEHGNDRPIDYPPSSLSICLLYVHLSSSCISFEIRSSSTQNRKITKGRKWHRPRLTSVALRGKNDDEKPGYLSASIYPIIPVIIPSTFLCVRMCANRHDANIRIPLRVSVHVLYSAVYTLYINLIRAIHWNRMRLSLSLSLSLSPSAFCILAQFSPTLRGVSKPFLDIILFPLRIEYTGQQTGVNWPR